LALGYWLLALGSWLLALGSWLLALGSWLLALGGSWLLALGSGVPSCTWTNFGGFHPWLVQSLVRSLGFPFVPQIKSND
jgi:hypothetical protein